MILWHMYYDPHFSGKETEGHRVHKTSKWDSWDLDRVCVLHHNTLHKTLPWAPTVLTIFEFQRFPLLPYFLPSQAPSLKIPPCLSVWKTPTYPTNVKSQLPWCPWAWLGILVPGSSLQIILLSWSYLSVCPLDCELLKSSSPKPHTMPNAWWCLDKCLQTEWMNVWMNALKGTCFKGRVSPAETVFLSCTAYTFRVVFVVNLL